ncbi:MAG: redox-regulated ATPase YchF [Thermoprotei archaeon]|nr:MAG: redox-regulated ATPase YchF [Thermoprotei archaeon]
MLIGLIGKTNVGKTALYASITMAPAQIENRPFTTIDPNVGVGYAKTLCACKELGVRDQPRNSLCINGFRYIPVKVVDVAGLVPGAHEGRGLGNRFLDELRRADALIHVVDASGSTDPDGKPCEPGLGDPCSDVEFIEKEVSRWFVDVVKRNWPRAVKTYDPSKGLVDTLATVLSGLSIEKRHVAEVLATLGLAENPRKWREEDVEAFALKLRRVAKPTLIAANKVDLPTSPRNVERLKKLYEPQGIPVVPCSAEAELALRRSSVLDNSVCHEGDPSFKVNDPTKLSSAQAKALSLIEERVLKPWGTTGVQEVLNTACFNLLNLIVVYPVADPTRLCDHEGRVLPDALLIPKGTTVRQLAYRLHTKLGDHFIYAIDARTKRRLGEDAELGHGDVVSIVSAKRG